MLLHHMYLFNYQTTVFSFEMLREFFCAQSAEKSRFTHPDEQ
jgi:hypothetical protein